MWHYVRDYLISLPSLHTRISSSTDPSQCKHPDLSPERRDTNPSHQSLAWPPLWPTHQRGQASRHGKINYQHSEVTLLGWSVIRSVSWALPNSIGLICTLLWHEPVSVWCASYKGAFITTWVSGARYIKKVRPLSKKYASVKWGSWRMQTKFENQVSQQLEIWVKFGLAGF